MKPSRRDEEPVSTLAEQSVPGRRAVHLDGCDVPLSELPLSCLRDELHLPELSELQVARHFEALAKRNFGVETGFYPLGSCTMKYNPKVCESLGRLAHFEQMHPLQDPQSVQGSLNVMFELQGALARIGGFDAVSLQPSAGAHGEFAALLMIRAYLRDQGESERDQVLIPDSAHGTNPASTTMAGYTVVEIPSDARGNVDVAALDSMCGPRTAALMLTNPNTLGLFDEHLLQVIQRVHACGGLVYGDGANMNALTGIMRPADAGIDLMHYNLHKTFGTPHGGGGPGAGPLAAGRTLAPYLPGPIVVKDTGEESRGSFALKMPANSIGPISGNFGNFGTILRAYAYCCSTGRLAYEPMRSTRYSMPTISASKSPSICRCRSIEYACTNSSARDGSRALQSARWISASG